MTSSTYSKGGTKLLKGGTKLLKGGTKLLKGGTKLLKGGTKLLKGGTKLLKGGTKSLGWATGGGRTTPPTPPLATGLTYVTLGMVMDVWKGVMSEPVSWYSLMVVKHVLSVIINSDASLMEEHALVQSPSLS